MKLPILLLLSALALHAETTAPSIIPQPTSVQMNEGFLPLDCKITINYNKEKLQAVAALLAQDLLVTHGIEACTKLSAQCNAGELLLVLSDNEQEFDYQLIVNESVVLSASDIDGLQAGAQSIVQSINSQDKNQCSIPRLHIKDKAYRDFRSLMVDVKNHWHSIDDLKKMIRMCRFYKLNYFSLHLGEEQWLAAICEQTEKILPHHRQQERLYTKAELDELIAYAHAQGVYMFPFNESTPHFNGMKRAISHDFLEGDQYAGFMDELIGGGAYTGNFDDERFWNFIKVATEKGIDQFKSAYPDKILPYYHVGPIYGEGGMGSDLAAKVLQYILADSPNTKMMCWNGIGADDPHLGPYKKNMVVVYYMQWGGSNIEQYLEQGWNVVNAAVSPLYIVGREAQPQSRVYNDWNYYRCGSGSFFMDVYAPERVEWFNFDKAGKQEQLVGGMLTTWEIRLETHFPQLTPRMPAYADNAWHYKKWPYDEQCYSDFQRRYRIQDELLKRYLSAPVTPAPVIKAASTDQVFEDKIRLTWSTQDDYALAYKIYRSEGDQVSQAECIDSAEGKEYEDLNVQAGKSYNYWVSSFNYFGESEKVGPLKGVAGKENQSAKAYEGFDYENVEEMKMSSEDTTSSYGWAEAWKFMPEETSTQLAITEGLSYGKLPVSGKALRIEAFPTRNKTGIKYQRLLQHKVAIPATSTWASFLIRPEKMESDADNCHAMFELNNIRLFMAKPYGSNIVGTQFKEGTTYFIVCKIANSDGADSAYSWINPSLNEEPSEKTAPLVERAFDLRRNQDATGSLKIDNYLFGASRYVVDEFRFGSTWSEVTGGVDLQAPSPINLTWATPPMTTKDEPTSAVMTCIEASDESDVEYYFAEISGNPGGADSGWIDTNYYKNEGLQAGYTYRYTVKARDKSPQQNETTVADTRDLRIENE